MLRNLGVQTVVLTGVSSNVAVPGLAVCAADLGYQAVIPEDCIAGASEEVHDFVVANLLPMYSTVTNLEEISTALREHA